MKVPALLLFIGASVFAQTTGATFEVASVKLSPPPDGRGFIRGCRGGPGTSDPGLWRCTNATISMLVLRGYDIQNYQLTIPDWANNTNYEINARLAPEATQEQFREMIRNLLTDRFKVELHWTKKEVSMYDLVIGKGGPKLKESVDQPTEDEKADAPRGNGPRVDAEGYPLIAKSCSGCMSINADGKARYQATKSSVKDFAGMLGRQLRMPVNDQTGLTGKYDITLSWSSGGGISLRADADDGDPRLTIESAVQQQLGLKLMSKKGPIDVIVVDKAERNPAEN